MMSAMVSAASSAMALGAAPVISVALTRLFSEKISRSVMLYTPFKGSVSDRALFYVPGNISRYLQTACEYAILE
mgnify:CR=1 FL=1